MEISAPQKIFLQRKRAANAALVSSCAEVLRGSFASIFLTELVNAARCVDDLLSACVERVTFGTDFNTERGLCHGGASLEAVAATASHGDFMIIGMDVGFHFFPCG